MALHRVPAESDTLTAVELARHLIARGSNVFVKDYHGDLLLNIAIRNHGADLDLQMLDQTRLGEQLSCKEIGGQTLLQIALAMNPSGERTFKELLKAGSQHHKNTAMPSSLSWEQGHKLINVRK